MVFLFGSLLLHLHQVLFKDVIVKRGLTVKLDEDEHPDQDVVAGGHFVESKKP
jgi:hypothetical protein